MITSVQMQCTYTLDNGTTELLHSYIVSINVLLKYCSVKMNVLIKRIDGADQSR